MGQTGQPEYMNEALFLAGSYGSLLEEQKLLSRRIAGSWEYTEEMAIADLGGLTVPYEREHVQTSGAGSPTERIAILLQDGYVEKRQREMLAHRDACVRELAYIDWKVGVIMTVMNERLDRTHRAVCYLLFARHRTFRETASTMRKKRSVRLYNRDIEAIKGKFLELLAREIGLRAVYGEEWRYVHALSEETRKQRGSAGGLSDQWAGTTAFREGEEGK